MQLRSRLRLSNASDKTWRCLRWAAGVAWHRRRLWSFASLSERTADQRQKSLKLLDRISDFLVLLLQP